MISMMRLFLISIILLVPALLAIDLSGLVDVAYNMTSPLERFVPTYVVEVDGCRVLVYVANFTLKNSPLTAPSMPNAVYYPRNMTVRPLTSAEVERLLDALFQALGPSAKAEVTIKTKDAEGYRELQAKARNATQLAEEARRAVGADFYLGAADAQKALKRGIEREAQERGAGQVAYLRLVEWWRGDIAVVFVQYDSAHLEVLAANLSAAVEVLRKAREAAGELWNSVEVGLWYGPYLVPEDESFREALRNAAARLEKELGTVREIRDERGQVRGAEGIIHLLIGDVGPSYVIFPYPNGTAPDRATAERLVRRFVELSGFCKSPLVVEFWPKTGYELFYEAPQTPPWPFVAVIVAAVVVAVGLLVLARRRR